MSDVLILEGDASTGRHVEAAEAVEQGGLPAAVWTNETKFLPRGDLESDTIQDSHLRDFKAKIFNL